MNNATNAPTVTGLLTYNQVAEILGVSTKQVYNLVNVEKTLKAVKFGRSVRFTVQHLADFLAAHEVTTTSTTSVPGQLELDLEIAATDALTSTTPPTPVGTQLAA